MYKWHVHSAIGRGGLVANDISKVTEGITASLRAFSDSALRCEGAGSSQPPSRSERSANAFREVASLTPRPVRGVDARSLAAAPPPTFTIRRVADDGNGKRLSMRRDTSPGAFGGSPAGAGGFRPRVGGDMRGGARGGGMRAPTSGTRGRGRGGRNMRGGARGRGRGGRGGGAKKPRQQKQNEDDLEEEPYDAEEKAYIFNSECGWPDVYEPTTSKENLALVGPPVISSARGVNETLAYKFQVASGNMGGDYKHAALHLGKIAKGSGIAFFEDEDQKNIANEWKKSKDKRLGGGIWTQAIDKREIGSLDKGDRDTMLKAWVGGQYSGPVSVAKGDVLGQVDLFLRRNETYLPEDTRKLEQKLSELLPVAKSQPPKRGRLLEAGSRE